MDHNHSFSFVLLVNSADDFPTGSHYHKIFDTSRMFASNVCKTFDDTILWVVFHLCNHDFAMLASTCEDHVEDRATLFASIHTNLAVDSLQNWSAVLTIARCQLLLSVDFSDARGYLNLLELFGFLARHNVVLLKEVNVLLAYSMMSAALDHDVDITLGWRGVNLFVAHYVWVTTINGDRNLAAVI